MSNLAEPKPFTGRHMLAIMIAFFGVIISVNVFMAYMASASWSGILAKNTYVASQDFNMKAAEARHWAERGFSGAFKVEGGRLEYRLEGPADEIGRLAEITALFHRPVGDKQDFSLTLPRMAPGVYAIEHRLAPGQWIVDLAAVDAGETVYHQAVRIYQPEK
ncbi:nitrogen fixation protein FixH [Rhizobium sp. SG_E_25_P2]|uniref:FixH family protein n=1 Tax=Rhizobium sp. SG_E_25_P2 TaxID=2879942 RepID=UPI002474A408|nr:FixH family protein [Rhizobium sp. SG_E_25_P2]MDH6267258.1 nitrogen fixation protein FixH [Rhizobium sp. SG_E_25_P2]